ARMIETDTLTGTALWRDYKELKDLRDGGFTLPIDYRAHETDYYTYEQTERHEARYRQGADAVQAVAASGSTILMGVGAGVGTFAQYLHAGTGCRYVPVEINPAGIQSMRATRLVPVCASGWSLPFAAGSANVLYAGEFIEHLHFQQFAAFMEEVRRVV